MALPKEPRQKMINIMYLVLTAILAINVSNEVIVAFKTVDASLQKSTGSLNAANDKMLAILKEEQTNEQSAQQAAIWEPKADSVRMLSKDLSDYIDDLKLKVKQGAGLEIKDGVERFSDDNLNSSTNLFENQGKGKEFEQKLYDYKAKILGLDTAINNEFKNSLPMDIAPPVTTGDDGKPKDFTRAYFHMTPTVAALTMLSKFQNNIANSENKVVAFCQREIGEVKVHMDKTAVLVNASANYVMPGDKLTIQAGVGAYSSAAAPIVTIRGTNVPVVDGVAKMDITAGGSGQQTVDVDVVYTNEHGVKVTSPEKVQFTVGTPGGSAVMLDKMNVFYIGVDNPVTIGSPTGWDKTQVSINGATITGNGSNRIVRVSKVGPTNINVTANGKTTSFPFRVKRIPDPVFKIGSGKPRMPSVEFKNQSFCRAELENFDFALTYQVIGATVYFSGANFPSVVQTQISGNNLAVLDQNMRRCGPGSVITFDNIKVKGPDGERTIDGKSFALY
ncbi:MAG TPA: GldM family protein [Ferruginibacter sp.]|jgi:gliding motility-associated protein GldM|nr:GldM family protein [Ferruginibacter sp.]